MVSISKIMKAKCAKEKFNISYVTLRKWARTGKIPAIILPSGQIDYLPITSAEIEKQRKVIIYSRVSAISQKEDLNKQTERLKSFCSSRGLIITTNL